MDKVLLDLGFKQDVGCRQDECRDCFYYGYIITFAFDGEGNGYSRLGRFDLTNFGFHRMEMPSFAAPVAA